MVFDNQALYAGNSPVLGKRSNAVRHHSSTRRVRPVSVRGGITPVGKNRAISGEPRLALNADRPTDIGNIISKEY